jgi:hypothetical protein
MLTVRTLGRRLVVAQGVSARRPTTPFGCDDVVHGVTHIYTFNADDFARFRALS